MGKCLSTIQQLTAYLGCLVEEYLMNGVEDISTTHYGDWYEDRYDEKMFMSRVHWTTIDPKIAKSRQGHMIPMEDVMKIIGDNTALMNQDRQVQVSRETVVKVNLLDEKETYAWGEAFDTSIDCNLRVAAIINLRDTPIAVFRTEYTFLESPRFKYVVIDNHPTVIMDDPENVQKKHEASIHKNDEDYFRIIHKKVGGLYLRLQDVDSLMRYLKQRTERWHKEQKEDLGMDMEIDDYTAEFHLFTTYSPPSEIPIQTPRT